MGFYANKSITITVYNCSYGSKNPRYSPRNLPPAEEDDPAVFGGVDAWDMACVDPKAGAESGRAPALIGVETALAEAD